MGCIRHVYVPGQQIINRSYRWPGIRSSYKILLTALKHVFVQLSRTGVGHGVKAIDLHGDCELGECQTHLGEVTGMCLEILHRQFLICMIFVTKSLYVKAI
eukprot:COSAG01_NODE_17899_length_1111_cov_4.144685_1_plen_101_part_00